MDAQDKSPDQAPNGPQNSSDTWPFWVRLALGKSRKGISTKACIVFAIIWFRLIGSRMSSDEFWAISKIEWIVIAVVVAIVTYGVAASSWVTRHNAWPRD
jgi:hypothetical protein